MKLIEIDFEGFLVGSLLSSENKKEMMKKFFPKMWRFMINPEYIQGLSLIHNNETWFDTYDIVMFVSGIEVTSDISFKLCDPLKLIDKIICKTTELESPDKESFNNAINSMISSGIPLDGHSCEKILSRVNVSKVHSLFVAKIKEALEREDDKIYLLKLFDDSINECFQGNG